MRVLNFYSFSVADRKALLANELPGYAYIGRPTIYGNPFVIGRDGTRAEVIEKYKQWFGSRSAEFRIEAFRKLAGRHLVCWCAPKACHGDVLLDWIESEVR